MLGNVHRNKLAMDNIGERGCSGRRVLARPGHVMFITRPHTSPKGDAAWTQRRRSDAGVMERSRRRQRQDGSPGSVLSNRAHSSRTSALKDAPDGVKIQNIRIRRSLNDEQTTCTRREEARLDEGIHSDTQTVTTQQGGTDASKDVSKDVPRDVSKGPAPAKSVGRRNGKSGHQERRKLHHFPSVTRRDVPDNVEQPGDKFVRILKGLRIIIGFCLAIKRCAQKHTETSVSRMLGELDEHANDAGDLCRMDLSLDKLKESGMAKPVKHLGQRLRSILYIPPEKRSLEDVRKIYVFLRMLPTFRNWSVVILLNFCRYAVYQKYQPRQVIIKRGHYPEGYYIILSGTVLVKEWTPDAGGSTGRSAYQLTCGDIFGEKELEDNLPRQSTVVCRTESELLTVSRQDYLEVVSRPTKKIMDENIKFLRSLQLFEHFPCNKLSDVVAEYSVKVYGKDAIVVPASDLMTNLVIIKTGKCKVVGEITKNDRSQPESALDVELRKMFPKEYERRHQQEMQRAHTSLELEWKTGEMRGVMKANLLMGVRDPERLIVSAGRKKQNKERNVESWTPSGYGLSRLYEKMETTKAKLRRSQTDMEPSQERKAGSEGDNREDLPSETSHSEMRRPSAGNRWRARHQYKTKQHKDPTSNLVVTGHELGRRKPDENDRRFVVLDVLGPGSVFGLETVFFRSPLRLSLVSEGAECISISKAFFVRESNVDVLNAATDVVIRYPSIGYIRKQVHDKRQWERYKKRLVRDVIQPRLTLREPSRLRLS